MNLYFHNCRFLLSLARSSQYFTVCSTRKNFGMRRKNRSIKNSSIFILYYIIVLFISYVPNLSCSS